MSHEIRKYDDMAFVGQVPWHGLGNQLNADANIETWIRAANMNWEIRSAPVKIEVEYGDPADPTREVKTFSRRVGLYRSDVGLPLSIVGDGYKVVQPRQVLEFFRELVSAFGFTLETAGTLKNGRYLWALARLNEHAVVLDPRDKVRSFLLLATACDGKFATTGQFTGVRVVCNNTLQYALGLGVGEDAHEKAVKISHMIEFDPVKMKDALGLAHGSFAVFMEQARRLASTPMPTNDAARYFTLLVGDPTLEAGHVDQPRTVAKLMTNYEGSPSIRDIQGAAGTAWGAVNAVTQFIDFQRPDRGHGGRLAGAWFGSGRKLKQDAWDLAQAYAKKELTFA